MRTPSLVCLALSLILCASGASAAPPAIPGLVGYWPIDEGEGSIVDECSGNGLGGAGRVQGAVQWEVDGGRPAFRFDGKSTAIRIPSNPAWDFGEGSLTICLWVKKAGKDARTGLTLDHYFSGTPGVWGLVDGPMFALYDDAKKSVKLGFPGFAYDQWQHLAIVWRKAVDGKLRTYLNGKLVGHAEGVNCIGKHPFDLFVGARQGTDQFSAGSVRDLAIFDRGLNDDEIAAIHAGGISLGSPVVVSSIQTDKILYGPKETGTITLRVKNVADSPQASDLVLYLDAGLHGHRELHRQPVELPPKAARLLHFPLAFRGEEFGCAVRAAIEQGGQSLTEKRDYFSVAESFARVGIGSSWEGGLQTANGKYGVIPEAARKLYSNYFEIFFWSPCDWALHVAPQKQWWSGQASYPEDEDNLVDLITKSHEQGIKVAFYASCNPAGPFGWEAARRHPEWFGGGNLGRNFNYNVEMLDHWNNSAWRATVKGNPGWYRLSVDLRREDALDYGIDRLIEGARKYHFDAVRFDGHYTILGNDEMSTRNMRRLKERVWKEIPGLGFGFNYGRAPEWLGGVNHEMREGMAGGGMYLQEGIRNWRFTNDQYTGWKDYATNELRVAKVVQGMGGDYHCMWSDLRLTPAQAYYKLIYGLIAGGHPADSGIYANTPGCPLWGAFMTRWSEVLWHPDLKAAPAEADHLTVAGDGLWWKELVQERVLSPTRKLVLVHLVDPAPEDAIAKTAFPAARDVQATCAVGYQAPGQKLVGTTLIRPDRMPFESNLEIVQGATVYAPWPKHWQIVALEVEGHFQMPAAPARFTEPPDPEKLKWSPDEKLITRADPNKADDVHETAGPNDIIVSLSTGGVNIGRVTTIDPESPQRSVQWRNKEKAEGNIGKFWTGPYAPGKYRTFIRLKWTDPDAQATPQSLAMKIMPEKGETALHPAVTFVTPGHPDAPAGAIVLGERGKYQTYELGPIEIKKAEFFTFDGKASTTNVGGQTLYAEKIVVQLVERYTDAQLAESSPVAKPESLPVPLGSAPKKILLVKGLFNSLYKIESAVNCTAVYALPGKYEDLYAYDAVVLGNVNMTTADFALRRMLRDYVLDGGRLVLLGGNATLGEGGMQGTYLDDLSPFALTGAGEVVKCDPPLRLGPTPDAPVPERAAVFWRHQVAMKPAAQAIGYAGAVPIAARLNAGKGVVTAFAGTVLGEGTPEARPFWEGPYWLTLARQLISE